jgi:hypothetical protein
MGWHKVILSAIEDRLDDKVAALKTLELWNNQFADLKGEENLEYPFPMPGAFIEFTGGDWQRQGGGRISTNYTVSLHIGWETYNDDPAGHLDLITDCANALDGWTYIDPSQTYAVRMEYRREFLDTERTNIIEHVLQFECTAEDCSQPAANPTQGRVVESEEIIRKIEQ